MSGGVGKENLRHYYADVFIPGIPADTTSELIARSVGDSLLVVRGSWCGVRRAAGAARRTARHHGALAAKWSIGTSLAMRHHGHR
jgi:hypothetical protein